MEKLLYEVRRPDESWARKTRAGALAAAALRLIRGRGRFTAAAPFRPAAEAAQPRRRGDALAWIWRASGQMHDSDMLSVRDGERRLVFRMRAVPAVDPRRTRLADEARWGCRHESGIHYSQARPYPRYARHSLPMWLDCSSSTITYARWAGAPDPSGYGFSGSGNTDSILRHLKPRRRIVDAELGDLILWHNGTDGKHVAVVVEPGSDPLLASHGSEQGPLLLRYSVENRYHASETATALDLLS